MNENINLCEILKGHKGETFYYYGKGNVVLKEIQNRYDKPYQFKLYRPGYAEFLYLSIYGTFHSGDNSLMLFPSKDQKDWIKWDKENNKTPKTWSELWNSKKAIGLAAGVGVDYIAYGDKESETLSRTPIEKSALALLKINQLIEVGYGGNVTDDEWKNNELQKWYFVPNTYYSPNDGNNMWDIVCSNDYFRKRNIAFHTKEQAEEFLSHPENAQLLRDYFMITDK